ncbi:MAG: 4Fe-4S dicluster domain-containing protein [Pirellulaceae bacterium]|nr:4Fe-4S dicluster domain-containing protein [Pirellulaceae bacterium]
MTQPRKTDLPPDTRAVPRARPTASGAPERDAPLDGLVSIDRRRFLEASGFALFVSALGGCMRAPVRTILSPAAGEEDAVAGLARYYASTCGGCPAACGVLVKTRDGRPIKLEGNPDHGLSQGGLCAVGQAEVLGLYDSQRLRRPLLDGQEVDWNRVDAEVRKQVAAAQESGRSVVLLTGTIHSPTTRAAIEAFLGNAPHARHVSYDPLSASAIGAAHLQTHGVRAIPRYRFDRAEVIVSLGADFLGTWISPVEYAAGYRTHRAPIGDPPRMSYHLQIESRMSLTGSNADQRWVVPSDALGSIAGRLAVKLAACASRSLDGVPPAGPLDETQLDALAERLWQARGKSLVVCDSQDVSTQIVCNWINGVLDGYGQTLEIDVQSRQRAADDEPLAELLEQLRARQVGVLVIAGVNPAYDLPSESPWSDWLQGDKAPFVVRLAQHRDETAAVASCVCPESHWLESWGDAEPVAGMLSLCQPTIPLLGSSRTLLECLLAWSQSETPADSDATAAYRAIRDHWQAHVFPMRPQQNLDAVAFWEEALRSGAVEVPRVNVDQLVQADAAVELAKLPAPAAGDSLSLVLYPKIGLLDGRAAHNPWLQELPDPVTKAVWDNYACLSPGGAERLGVRQEDMLRITAGQTSIELPVLIQPGQHDDVVAVALGYGRLGTDRFARVGPQWIEARPSVGDNGLVGVNAAPLLQRDGGTIRYARGDIRVEATGGHRRLATTQQHHSLSVPEHLATPGTEHRAIVEQTTLAAYRDDPHAGAAHHHHFEGELWPDDHPFTGARWGMVIDLNKCSGCSACVIACQAENNVPVVGRDEVLRSREMHWIRIDRYFQDHSGGATAVHQPMLCHHCDNAPCENVCPVLATVHSAEGLNQQVYNRCVGTRYCANNCPYKVRRFNWFEYSRGERLENAALNPDITVRSRGVMEKCSFCVQRIQEATRRARQAGQPVADGSVQAACQQSCPSAAIVFGDLNDPESAVAKAAAANRHFQVLAELNVRPSVGYLRVVRNSKEHSQEGHHG